MRVENIYVIVCYGISDIGKGWLTASIGALDVEGSVAVKIDPLLNTRFPPHLGVPIGAICSDADIDAFISAGRARDRAHRVSEDMLTYMQSGLTVYPECNIVGGDLISSFLAKGETEVRPGETKKLTFNDLSYYLCSQLVDIAKRREPKTLLIEVGGTLEDPESIYIPAAIRFLAQDMGVTPEMVLLTYFEYAEAPGTYRVKTQSARRGLAAVSRVYYGLPIKACFVRRRTVPSSVSDDVLISDLAQAAYETQTDSSKLVLLPNVARNERARLQDAIRQTGLFAQNERSADNRIVSAGVCAPTLISACLLGVCCQYDGNTAKRELDRAVVDRFGTNLIPVCPEQLGGLPTPRKPMEIVGGDGDDVLDGKARVASEDGTDCTYQFLRGAHEVLQIAQQSGARQFVTQKRSPSCSCAGIYDGTFQHRIVEGAVGVCAALLARNDIRTLDVDKFEGSLGESLENFVFQPGS